MEKIKKSPTTSPKTVLTFILLLLITAVLICAGYWYKDNKTDQTQKSAPAPTATTPEESSIGVWNTYVNQRFNYSVQYPPKLILMPLSGGDNPFTDAVEIGDEGTFIVEKTETPGETDKSIIVEGIYLNDRNKNLTLKEFAETQGSFINLCHEDRPEKTQEVTAKSGAKGIEAWYWIKEGCEGAEARKLNDPYVFFDARPTNDVIIELYEGQIDDVFPEIVSTFTFIEPRSYGD
ncbi:MAG: hypothetical protein WC650_05245 [Candidatus Doudnabacteria bacterium]